MLFSLPAGRSALLANPCDVFGNGRVRLQQIQRGIVAAEILLARNQSVNGSMAITAQVDRHSHFFPGKTFLEPTISMTRSRNQMVLRRALTQSAIAHLTRSRLRHRVALFMLAILAVAIPPAPRTPFRSAPVRSGNPRRRPSIPVARPRSSG